MINVRTQECVAGLNYRIGELALPNEEISTWLKSPDLWEKLFWPIVVGFAVGLLNFFGFHVLQGHRSVLGIYLLDRPPLSYAYLLSGAAVLVPLIRWCVTWVVVLWIVQTIAKRLVRVISKKIEGLVADFLPTRTCGWSIAVLAFALTAFSPLILPSPLTFEGLILVSDQDISAFIETIRDRVSIALNFWFPLAFVIIILFSRYLFRHESLPRIMKVVYLIWTAANLYVGLSAYAWLYSVSDFVDYYSSDVVPVVTFSNSDRYLEPNSTSLLLGSDSKLYAILSISQTQPSKDAAGKATTSIVGIVKTIVYVKREDVKWLKVLRQDNFFKLAFPQLSPPAH